MPHPDKVLLQGTFSSFVIQSPQSVSYTKRFAFGLEDQVLLMIFRTRLQLLYADDLCVDFGDGTGIEKRTGH